ncbi:MAG TPA: response regulator [candidate division Zixibacteria bacterium]|nr:response regulator [candidate division Zixibacteria bacterium]
MSDNIKETVIIVDDEEMVLKSLGAFLSLETEYNVQTFVSANEALKFIESNGANVVISDYLMPEMDGMKFLKHVKDLKPEVPRIILTGYADKENAIKGINEVGLYQYLEKPWDNSDLLIILRNALERQRLVKALLDKMDELKGLQDAVLKAFI